MVHSGFLHTGFGVINEGRGRAEEVELGLITNGKSLVGVFPDFGAIITNDGGDGIMSYRIVVPYLLPDQAFVVSIWPESALSDKKSSGQADTDQTGEESKALDKTTNDMPPSITYIRSKSGVGEMKMYSNEDAD